MATTIQLSDHFDFARLLRFTAPTMGTMAFLSVYVLVDGFFVSNFVGKTALAAVNLIWPLVSMLGVVGMMIGSGGSALVGKLLGQGKAERANQVFSMLIWLDLVLGIVLGIACFILVDPVARLLGASGELLSEARIYGCVLAASVPFTALQSAFQSFLVTDEHPKMGFVVIVSAGIANVVLDALFIVAFGWGIGGAALATLIGEIAGGTVPFLYFLLSRTSLLRLRPARIEPRVVGATAFNGLSELLSNISMSLVGLLYNYQLMIYIGADGVAAFGVVADVSFIFMSLFLGYCTGSSPIVSFNFGANNHVELSNVLRRSLFIIAVLGVLQTILAGLVAPSLAQVFVGYDASLTELTVHALSLYKWAFLLMGFNVFGSAFFTALNNGVVSASIAVARTLLFECVAVLVMPLIFGANGIWFAMPAAEVAALFVTVFFMVYLHGFYGYTLRRQG